MNLSKSTFISLLIHSEMKGSYSIKYVLPALVPELSYNDLDIKE